MQLFYYLRLDADGKFIYLYPISVFCALRVLGAPVPSAGERYCTALLPVLGRRFMHPSNP